MSERRSYPDEDRRKIGELLDDIDSGRAEAEALRDRFDLGIDDARRIARHKPSQRTRDFEAEINDAVDSDRADRNLPPMAGELREQLHRRFLDPMIRRCVPSWTAPGGPLAPREPRGPSMSHSDYDDAVALLGRIGQSIAETLARMRGLRTVAMPTMSIAGMPAEDSITPTQDPWHRIDMPIPGPESAAQAGLHHLNYQVQEGIAWLATRRPRDPHAPPSNQHSIFPDFAAMLRDPPYLMSEDTAEEVVVLAAQSVPPHQRFDAWTRLSREREDRKKANRKMRAGEV